MTSSTPRPQRLAALSASKQAPTSGALAQASLAADAAEALQWTRLVTVSPGVAEVSATVDALRRLRTDLRTLRPILDRAWSVQLRAQLEEPQEYLSAVQRLDEEIRLLGDPTVAPVAVELIEKLTSPRQPLLAMAAQALEPATKQALVGLADGSGPAPLRTAAPFGDAHQPATYVLPAMLHRRWRKILKETEPADLPTVERRTQELLVVTELAARGGLDVSRLTAAAGNLLHCVTAALRADYANQMRAELPSSDVRKQLARLAKGGKSAARGIRSAYADLASVQLRMPADAPARCAAGGLVVRASKKGTQVLLVHRIRHDDWSIPKGSAMPGEPAERCAVREVREETGLRCQLHRLLHTVSYRDRNGRPKLVRYWVMSAIEEVCEPDRNEIDQTRWVPLETAEALMTRGRERAVLQAYQDEDKVAC